MPTVIQDPRLTLLGAGFAGDPEVQDGVHLRWSFDPALGFPREGFQLYSRSAAGPELSKVSFRELAQELKSRPAPAGVASGITVHRRNGERLVVSTRCGQTGLDLGGVPLVVRFRPSFGSRPQLVRQVTLIGFTAQGGVLARTLHRGRVTDCAGVGAKACMTSLSELPSRALIRLGSEELILPGRTLNDLRRATKKSWSALLKTNRSDAMDVLDSLRGARSRRAATTCTPFQITLAANAIDEVRISGCNATLLAAVVAPLAPDEADRNWRPLHGPVCLPVENAPGYPCNREPGQARDVALSRLPDQADLPPLAPTKAATVTRLLGSAFGDLRAALESALNDGITFTDRIPSDDIADPSAYRLDVVSDVLTAAADPYFARIVGLYWVHEFGEKKDRLDYKLEAVWKIGGVNFRFCWIAFNLAPEPQSALPAPTDVTATSRPGGARTTVDGVRNPFEMDVVIGWRRPAVCELADPLRMPISYLIERTDVDGAAAGPYHLLTRRVFERGGEPEVVPAMITDSTDGQQRTLGGFYLDRGPGYGRFYYRVQGRDLFGRSSDFSTPGSVLVRDEVSPGPPLNLAAVYMDPADPERAGSEVLDWANRDLPAGNARQPGVLLHWVWPLSRQLQFPDLDEFRLYYHRGPLNHILGNIVGVTPVAAGEFEVVTDIAPAGPDFPSPPPDVDLGTLRSEGEECRIIAAWSSAGTLVFRVRASAAAPPLPGLCTFRLGRGTSPTATEGARLPHPEFRNFEEAWHWGGLILDPESAGIPLPLRIGADGAVRSPLPAGLSTNDIAVTRIVETDTEGEHWHYRLLMRNVVLSPNLHRPKAIGTFGITAADIAGNEGKIAPPATIFSLLRTQPTVPELVYPPVNLATPADYHGRSSFTLEWAAERGMGYLVYRIVDAELLEAAGASLAAHRARSPDEQRLELQQLASNSTFVDALRLVTAEPLIARDDGLLKHVDSLPGAVQNRFVYRLRAVDSAGNLAGWPSPADAKCIVVDLPGVPPTTPELVEPAFLTSGFALRWVPNAESTLLGYRVYRSYDARAAEDVRSMEPQFTAAEPEGTASIRGIQVVRDSTGAVSQLIELSDTSRPTGRLLQYVDTTAKTGGIVYYRVVAEDQSGRRSLASRVLAVQPPKREPPEPPSWTGFVAGVDRVALDWQADEDDLRCLVMRRQSESVWRSLGPWSPVGDYSYIDETVTAGSSYEYLIRVRDRVGHVVDGPVLAVETLDS